MPSNLLMLLAQEAPPAGPAAPKPPFWDHLLTSPQTEIFGLVVPYRPIVAIPVFLGALVVVSLIVERVSGFIVKRLTSRTDTRVDDEFFGALPGLIRTFLAAMAASVVVHALLQGDSESSAAKIVVGLSVFVAGVLLVRMAIRMTDAWAEMKPERRPVGPGIKLALKVAAIPLLIVSTMHAIGIDITPLLTVLGVGSLAVALALQDVLKNLFSGLQLVVDQPMRPGDFIVLDDGKVRGTVLEVGLRSTRIRTVENNTVMVPNATVAGAVITNTDVQDPTYAHVLKIGVAYSSDPRRVQQVLEDEVAKTLREVPGFVPDTGQVFFVEMADFALVFRVVVRLKQFSGYFAPISELNQRVFARLAEEAIEIPFPTRTVVVRHSGGAAGTSDAVAGSA